MNINFDAVKNVSRVFGTRVLSRTKHYSPEILTVTGIVALVAAGVVAAKATTKLEQTVYEAENRILTAKRNGEIDGVNDKAQLTKAYSLNVLSIAKLYLPAATLAIGGTICILGAHNIMRKRTVAVVAAYKGLEETFNRYRARVIEELGEEKDQDFRLGITEKEVTVKGEKVIKHVHDPNGLSTYARWFDDGSRNWRKNAEANLAWLTAQQNYFNDLLRINKFVFLNDVYDALDIEKTQAGQVVGWYLDADNGDNYIDFGIYDHHSREFVNGNEAAILLDFNVDGVIIDKI